MGLSYRLTPLEEEIVALLRVKGMGMDIIRIEQALGRDRHDPEVLKALGRLKSLGILRRRGTGYNHLVIWTLM